MLDNAVFLLVPQILLYSVCLVTAEHSKTKYIYNLILQSCNIQILYAIFTSYKTKVSYASSIINALVVLDECRHKIYLYANTLLIQLLFI